MNMNSIDINEPVRILGYNSEKSWRSYAGSRERVDGNFRFHFNLGTGILCFGWSPRSLETYYFPKRLTFDQAQEMAEALLSGKDKAEGFIKLGYGDDLDRKEVFKHKRGGSRYWSRLFGGSTLKYYYEYRDGADVIGGHFAAESLEDAIEHFKAMKE